MSEELTTLLTRAVGDITALLILADRERDVANYTADYVDAINKHDAAASGVDGKCPRCVVLEDLLETARIQVEHARQEAEKADDEALAHKAENLRLRMAGTREDYALIKAFEARAKKAEAALLPKDPDHG